MSDPKKPIPEPEIVEDDPNDTNGDDYEEGEFEDIDEEPSDEDA